MKAFTELFARPRPKHDGRFHQAGDVLGGTRFGDFADFGAKPADFPRIARQVAGR